MEFPSCFDNMKSSDANFELVGSNTLQPLRLVRQYNIVSRSIGVIFVNTETRGLNYDGVQKRAELQKEVLSEHLKLDDVQVHTDLSKVQYA